jgi:bifunctional UDP-N-acetylglucosamine pyrophosphorylase/glucosamine-1-phosphate N-acetyltransferase
MEQIKQAELINYWIAQGVRFIAAHTVQIDHDVHIGSGTIIDANVHLKRASKLGAGVIVHPFSIIDHSVLEDEAEIYAHSIIKNSHIGARAKIGPFAHVTENSIIQEGAIIGNFVEVKRSTIGKKSKAKHLAYLGDATLGNGVNIGAGTITCNHDGVQKHATIIKDGAYVGSNNTLVAPLTIEENAFTAAGSTITASVPQDALAIGRARQVIKEGYAKKLRAKKKQQDAPFIAALKTDGDTTLSEGQ